ncbi:MAG: hypothetical protein JSS82_03550 [Bacteroidetes bacterium]|nr:hypothetical protein [Bacteroidota bacterium]
MAVSAYRGAFSTGVEVELVPPKKGTFKPLQLFLQKNQLSLERALVDGLPKWLMVAIHLQGVSDSMLHNEIHFDPETLKPVYNMYKECENVFGEDTQKPRIRIMNPNVIWIADPHERKIPATQHQVAKAVNANREMLKANPDTPEEKLVIANDKDTLGAVMRSNCSRNFKIHKPAKTLPNGGRMSKTKRRKPQPLPQFEIKKIRQYTDDDVDGIVDRIRKFYVQKFNRVLPHWLFGDLETNQCLALDDPHTMYTWYPMVVHPHEYHKYRVYITVVMRVHTLEMMMQEDIGERSILSDLRMLQDSYHYLLCFMTDTGRLSDESLFEYTYNELTRDAGIEDPADARKVVDAIKYAWTVLKELNEDAQKDEEGLPERFRNPVRHAQRYFDIVKPSICNVMHEGELPNLIPMIQYIFSAGDRRANIPFQLTLEQEALFEVLKKFEPRQMGLRSTDDMALVRAKESYLVYKTLYLLVFASFCGYYDHCQGVTKFCIRHSVYRHLAYTPHTREEFIQFLSGHYSLCYNREEVKPMRHPKLILYIIKEYAAAMIRLCPSLHMALQSTIIHFDPLINNWMEMMNSFRKFLGDVIYGSGVGFLRSTRLIDQFYTKVLESTAEKIVCAAEIKDTKGTVVNPLTRKKQKACNKPYANITTHHHRSGRAASEKTISEDVKRTVTKLDSEGFLCIHPDAAVLCDVDDTALSDEPWQTPKVPFVPPGIIRGAIRCMLEFYLAYPTCKPSLMESNDWMKKAAGWIVCTTPREEIIKRKKKPITSRDSARCQLMNEEWVLTSNKSEYYVNQKATVKSVLESVRNRSKTPHAAEIAIQCTNRYVNMVASSAWLYVKQQEETYPSILLNSNRDSVLARLAIAARRIFRDAIPVDLWPEGVDKIQWIDTLIERYCGKYLLEPIQSDYRHLTYISHAVSMIYEKQRCSCQHCSPDHFGKSINDWDLYMEFQETQHRGYLGQLIFGYVVLSTINVMLESSYGSDHDKMYRTSHVSVVERLRSLCTSCKYDQKDNKYLQKCVKGLTEAELLYIDTMVQRMELDYYPNPLWMVEFPLRANLDAITKLNIAIENYVTDTYPSHLPTVMNEMFNAYPRTALLVDHWSMKLWMLTCRRVYNLPLHILQQQICTRNTKYNMVGPDEPMPSQCSTVPICLIHGELKTQRANGDPSVVGGVGYVGINVDFDTNGTYCMVPIIRSKARTARHVDRVVSALYHMDANNDEFTESQQSTETRFRTAVQFSSCLMQAMRKGDTDNQIDAMDDDQSDDDGDANDINGLYEDGTSDDFQCTPASHELDSDVPEIEMTHVINPRKGQRMGRGTAAASKSAVMRLAKLKEPEERERHIYYYGEESYNKIMADGFKTKKIANGNNMASKSLRDDLCTEPLVRINMLGRMVQMSPNKNLIECPLCSTQMNVTARSFGPLGLSCGECTKDLMSKLLQHCSDAVRFICTTCPIAKCAYKAGEVQPALVFYDGTAGERTFVWHFFCREHYRVFIGNLPETTRASDLSQWLTFQMTFKRVGDTMVPLKRSSSRAGDHQKSMWINERQFGM